MLINAGVNARTSEFDFCRENQNLKKLYDLGLEPHT